MHNLRLPHGGRVTLPQPDGPANLRGANSDGLEPNTPEARRGIKRPAAPLLPSPRPTPPAGADLNVNLNVNVTRRVQCRAPMLVFDLETTGKYTDSARIVQFAGIKRYPDGREEVLCWRINPGCPIPAGASEIHKIYDADVQESPHWHEVVGPIYRFMRDAPVWIGHNIHTYDVPLLRAELGRQGYELPSATQVDTLPIFQAVVSRPAVANHRLTTAYRYCTGQDFDGAHDALADARASLVVLDRLVARFPQLPNTPDKLAAYQVAWRR